MKLHIDRSYKDQGRLPLYHKYPQQTSAQPAYMEIENDGSVRFDWSGEIGNAVPERVWNGRAIRISVPHNLTATGINRLLNDLSPMIEEMLDHFEIIWNGSNQVGRFDERGSELRDEIEYFFESPTFLLKYECGFHVGLDWFDGAWSETAQEYRDVKDRDVWFEDLKQQLWFEEKLIIEDEKEFIEALEEEIKEEQRG